MADKKEPKNIDIFIVEVVTNTSTNKKDEIEVTNLLRIPKTETTENVAIRVYDKKEAQSLYASTRLGSIETDVDGLFVNVTGKAKELSGCRYELTEQGGSKKLLASGKIANKQASAKVVEIGKTGS